MIESKLRSVVLGRIKTDESEHAFITSCVESVIKNLTTCAEKLNIDCNFFVGGSFGKNTYLKNNSDVDVFARFSLSYDDDKLNVYLEKILELAGYDYKKLKGSRDYFAFSLKNGKISLDFEIVPNRFILSADKALNTTDVSPFHVEFIKKIAKKNPSVCDEIRLAKQFFKSKKLYGAESYIKGFSGHVIDIMISYYGSLENLLNDAKTWGEEKLIDINNEYGCIDKAKDFMGKCGKSSRLIVVDPVLKERNAAKSLSDDNYARFILIANFILELKESDFIINDVEILDLFKSAKKFAESNGMFFLSYIVSVDMKGNSCDIVGSKLLKLHGKLKKYYESYDFFSLKDTFSVELKRSNQALMVFFFEYSKLSDLKKVIGPYVHMKDSVANFIKDKKFYFVEDFRVYSYQKRDKCKLKDIAFVDALKMEKLLGKDMSFVSKVRFYSNL